MGSDSSREGVWEGVWHTKLGCSMRRKSCSDVGLSSSRTNHFFLLDTKVEMTSLNNLISNPEWDWMLLTPFRSSMSTWSWDGIVHKC